MSSELDIFKQYLIENDLAVNNRVSTAVQSLHELNNDIQKENKLLQGNLEDTKLSGKICLEVSSKSANITGTIFTTL